MRPFDRPGPISLSRYWTALVQVAPSAELKGLAAQLDPAMLALIARMRTTRTELVPDPAFVDRLEETLLRTTPGATSMPVRAGRAPRPAAPVAPLPRPHFGHFERILPIAMAAALVLAIFGGFLAGRRTDWGAPKATAPAPAIQAPGTPSPGADLTDATLLDVVFPAELLPTLEKRVMGSSYVRVEAGSAGTFFATCCDGPLIEYVLSGSLTLTFDKAVQVMRADGALEEIGPDIEFVIGPGDALIARSLITFDYANTGTDPVEMVEWGYSDDPSRFAQGHQLEGWGGPGGLDVTYRMPFFTDPVRVTLQRHVLDPGEMVSFVREEGIRQLVTPNIETDVIFRFGDGSFMAVDSSGQQTIAYSIEVMPILLNRDLPEVGLPPE